MSVGWEILIIFVLLLGNGVFAMAEIAVVSSRKARLKALAATGSARAKAALALAEQPDRFLSTVQVGITLVGVLAGALGGATLTDNLSAFFGRYEALAAYAPVLSMVIVVGAITYFSLIIGELVPKRVALGDPEGRAMLVALPMTGLSRLAAPVVWLLTVSTNAVLRVVGLGKEVQAPPSEEEVSHLIEQGTSAGVFHSGERAMVEGVLRLDERHVTDIMTRSARIVWLNVSDPDDVNWRKIVASGHSHFPVYEGTRDNVIGMVSVKSLWANAAAGVPNNLRVHLTTPLFVPSTIDAARLLESFKKTGKHLALVTDEYGSVQGIVSLIDVMEAIVGDLPEPGDRKSPEATRREDGSWLVDGAMRIDDLRRRIALPQLPGEGEDGFETVGGFVADQLGHIPKAGEAVESVGWKFEVVDMDRNRVDKVLISARAPIAVDPEI
jgi:putative hemolysin